MIKGKHLIAGQWMGGETTFTPENMTAQSVDFFDGSDEIVNLAVNAASTAFFQYSQSLDSERATLLRSIAEEINKNKDEICAVCVEESGLPLVRVQGECGRTTHQLEMFADHIEQGEYLESSFDAAIPDREPLPRPELRKIMRPLGPVAVFGASNFPLAFSTAGGDTASALAAGCPVVVKGHPAHPATSDLIAQAMLAAIEACSMDVGIFSLIQDSGYSVAQYLVSHPEIKAVGFTGSLKGGRYLFDLCVKRPEPIPFYGEMGSINPVFVLQNALENSAEKIAREWVASLTLGAGQFCTKPGLLVVPTGIAGDQLVSAAVKELQQHANSSTMLTTEIAHAYDTSLNTIQGNPGTEVLIQSRNSGRETTPHVITTDLDTWLNDKKLQEEIFGPFAVILRVENTTDMFTIAKRIEGQLTATMHFAKNDHTVAKQLLQLLEQKAGRIIANGFPTGVELVNSMVHGGPYPACTYAGCTSVGSMAIKRFLKPISYQNIPQNLLPEVMQELC